jgi:hypothetical protein
MNRSSSVCRGVETCRPSMRNRQPGYRINPTTENAGRRLFKTPFAVSVVACANVPAVRLTRTVPEPWRARLMWKKHRSRPSGERSSGTGGSSSWHAVSIITTNSSCYTARALRAIRFLSHEAPRLPLPQCSAGGSCPCAYKHYDDRRRQPRRAEELTGLRRPNPLKTERRQQRGRRSSDF